MHERAKHRSATDFFGRVATSVLDLVKRWIRRSAVSFAIGRRIYGAVVLRFTDRRSYVRYQLTYLLSELSKLITGEQLVGGVMTDEGEFYLRMRDGVFLFYNFSDPQRTLGDGQSLEFQTAHPGHLEAFISQQLGDRAVYIDVGANNGYYYTLKVAKTYPKCRVYAFEPDPRILPALRKNVAFNGAVNITVAELALSDSVGVGRMPAFAGASGWLVTGTGDGSLLVNVCVSTLDQYVQEQDLERVDVIKVDIEGGEYRFLSGAQQTLLQRRPVVAMELREDLLRRSAASTADVVALCRRLRYDVYRVMGTADAVLLPRERASLLFQQNRSWLEALGSSE